MECWAVIDYGRKVVSDGQASTRSRETRSEHIRGCSRHLHGLWLTYRSKCGFTRRAASQISANIAGQQSGTETKLGGADEETDVISSAGVVYTGIVGHRTPCYSSCATFGSSK